MNEDDFELRNAQSHYNDRDAQYEMHLRAQEEAHYFLIETDQGKFATALFNLVTSLLLPEYKQDREHDDWTFRLAAYAESFKKEDN